MPWISEDKLRLLKQLYQAIGHTDATLERVQRDYETKQVERKEASSDTRRVRAAQNQILFALLVERAKALGEKVPGTVVEVDFACECADPQCTQTITLSPKAFDKIAGDPNRFIVIAGHEIEEDEGTIEFGDGYVIVAKRGAGAEYVRQHS